MAASVATIRENITGAAFVSLWRELGGPELQGDRGRAWWRNGEGLNVSIESERGLWRDHVTGDGGDAITLIERVKRCSNREALEWAEAEGYRTPSRRRNAVQEITPKLVATYPYVGSDGALLYEVCRYEPGKDGQKKHFAQRRPDGRGGWVWNLDGVSRVPYRLRELQSNPSATIHIVEGEKDVATLENFGLLATCNAGGSAQGKQYTQWLDIFAGRHIIIIPDKDAPGRKHAHAVASMLLPVAASVKVVELPGLPDKGDVTDWANSGGTKDRFSELVTIAKQIDEVDLAAFADSWGLSTAPAKVGSPKGGIVEVDNLDLTDAGLAALVAKIHGGGIRRVLDAGEWRAFDGKRWTGGEPAAKAIERHIESVGRELYDRAPGLDNGLATKAARAAMRVLNTVGTLAVLSRLAAVESIGTTSDKFDQDGELLNVANGTLNLRTGEMHPHRAEDFITRLIDIPYSATAPAERWGKALEEIFEHNPELPEYLQRAMGYAATGLIREHVFHLLIGVGRNGKSLLVETLAGVLGEYSFAIAADTLARAHDLQRPRPDIALMRGRRFAFSQESNRGTPLDEALIKKLTGGDTISARVLHQNPINFRSTAKLFLSTNHAPEISGTETAIWRRMRLIPFKVSFAGREDVSLARRLEAEREGILAWIVEGAARYFDIGLDAPEVVTQATDRYRRESDQLGRFVDECLEFFDGASVAASRLQAAYRGWCTASGEREQRAALLAEYLGAKGIEKRRGASGLKYMGVSVRPEMGAENAV